MFWGIFICGLDLSASFVRGHIISGVMLLGPTSCAHDFSVLHFTRAYLQRALFSPPGLLGICYVGYFVPWHPGIWSGGDMGVSPIVGFRGTHDSLRHLIAALVGQVLAGTIYALVSACGKPCQLCCMLRHMRDLLPFWRMQSHTPVPRSATTNKERYRKYCQSTA